MTTLPLNLMTIGKTAVLVGGGAVACRKARMLRQAGLAITVIAPELAHPLSVWAAAGELVWLSREYLQGDLAGAFLVIAATNQREVNRQVASDALRQAVLVNVADEPDEGNCSFPAVLQRGALQVAVSTDGVAPAVAAAIRDELAGVLDSAYGQALELLAQQREKLLTLGQGDTYNTRLIKELLAAGLLDLVRQGELAAADALIQRLSAAQKQSAGYSLNLKP